MLGRVAGLFGIRGELKIAPTRIGEDVLHAGLAVTLRSDRFDRQDVIARVRRHKAHIIVALGGVARAEAAKAFAGASMWTLHDNVVLREGEYYDEDLIGCRIVQAGRDLGVVRAVHHYPAQDVLELERGALVPMVSAFVRNVDLGARVIDVELPLGLVEGEPL